MAYGVCHGPACGVRFSDWPPLVVGIGGLPMAFCSGDCMSRYLRKLEGHAEPPAAPGAGAEE